MTDIALSNEPNKKIFGIGFHKTGTKSLSQALLILGYKVTGPNLVNKVLPNEPLFNQVSELLDQFEAFQDNPWPLLYKELDRYCPNSKFILTIRPSEQWISSVIAYFGENTTLMRELIYGVGKPVGNEELYLEKYENHNRDVIAYFKNRPNDFLQMEITRSDGWNKLCPFLGHAIPETPFPNINKSK